MALRPPLVDLAHDDDDLYDLAKGMGRDYEPPEYPSGLCLSLCEEDLEAVGGKDAKPGETMRFSAMGEVTSIFVSRDDARVELEVAKFAGEDGKFCDLSEPGHICLEESQLAKLGLECDCERGDTIHLIGEARVESCSSTEFGGDRCMLQITGLTYVEDESGEGREA
jgi:hypothetical protein